MVKELQPYIVTSWHGHRDSPSIPTAVAQVWAKKFQPGQPGQPRGGGGAGMQSNVDLAVLDSEGHLVHSFDGFRHQPGPGRPGERDSLATYTARELRSATSRMKVADRTEAIPLKLPDAATGPAVRVFVRLKDDRMTAYQAPVVEVVPLTEDEWKRFDYPESERRLEARDLKQWLREVYPPGVMERTDPRTRKVYQIASVEGALTLRAAGRDSHGERRYAILSGTVRLTDEGTDQFSYEGKLEIVLAYPLEQAGALTLRGSFEGIYPRTDPRQGRTRQISLQAVFESRPE